MKLTDSIDYNPGGVAKKMIMSNNSGMVILMAFDKGASIPTHSANADVMVQMVEGECEFTVGNETRLMRAGDFLMMSPGMLHSLHAPERFKVLVTKLNA